MKGKRGKGYKGSFFFKIRNSKVQKFYKIEKYVAYLCTKNVRFVNNG